MVDGCSWTEHRVISGQNGGLVFLFGLAQVASSSWLKPGLSCSQKLDSAIHRINHYPVDIKV